MFEVVSLTGSARRLKTVESPDIEAIFTQYFDSVYRYVHSHVGNREDAEDLTSEVFLKAARGIDGARAEASIAHWLFTVARTVMADHWRRYYRLGAVSQLDETRIGETMHGTQTDTLSNENERLVADVLHALPANYRSVLELRFLRGYSIDETAHELQLSIANVKVIQHRALHKAVELAGNQI